MNATPLLKDLQNYITPDYAVHWRVIGSQLGVCNGTLDIIEHDNYHKAVRCCNAMWEEWLAADSTATWSKLLSVIHSPAVFSGGIAEKGDYIKSLFPFEPCCLSCRS